MIRIICIFLLLALARASLASPLADSEKRIIMARFNTFNGAYFSKNYETMLGFIFPPVVELSGGRDKFISQLRSVEKATNDSGLKILSLQKKEPTEVIDAGDYEVCVIETNTLMSIKSDRIKEVGFTLAVRRKGSGPWSFIGGSGLRNSPEVLYELLPGLSKSVRLPLNVIEKIDPAGPAEVSGSPGAQELVKIMTKGLSFPIHVDQFTQLDSLVGSGSRLTYNYSLIIVGESPNDIKSMMDKLRASGKSNICKSENYSKLSKGGFTLIFNYSTDRAEQTVHIEIKPGDCPV